MKTCVTRLLEAIDRLLFPADVLCLACDRAMEEDAREGICHACARALSDLAAQQEANDRARETPPEGIAYVHAAYAYDAQARRLIHKLKYERVRAAAVPLARQMALLPSGEETVLVPVPTDRARQRRRGFNQATVLARHIGKELGMEVACALERTERRRPQTGLSVTQRRENLRFCMRVKPPKLDAIRGKRVLLVDDVYTTGATAAEAARALLEGGAQSVGVFAAARAMNARDDAQDPFIRSESAENRQKT